MANMTGTSQVGPGVDNYYDKLLLARAKPYLIHTMAAQQRNLPSKNSDTIKFRRYTNLSTATTPLTEGVSPNGQALDITDMTVQLQQYGDYVTLTDKVQYVIEDQILNESSKLLGQQMGETLDELTRDVLAATASVTSCTGGINGSTPTELTYSDIQGVVKALMGQSARMFVPSIKGKNEFGTAPIRAAYWALADTDLLDDLEDIDEFNQVANYPGGKGLNEAEWGSVGNTRWLLSPFGYVSSGTYSCFICGEDAYATSKMNELSASNLFKPLGHGDDPLNQRSTYGWKVMYASRILNDNWLVNLQCTHS